MAVESFIIKASEYGFTQEGHYPLLLALNKTVSAAADGTSKSVLLAADPTNRRLLVDALLAAGSATIGKVDQGAPTTSTSAAAWPVKLLSASGDIVLPFGQQAMASSLPVAIASNQTAIPIAEPVTVDAVDLDIRNLLFALDKVDASGSGALAVTALSGVTQLPAALVGGRLDVNIGASIGLTISTFPDNEPFNLAQVGGSAVITAGIAGLLAVGGNVAHGVADAGNPVKIGGRAQAEAGSLAVAAQRVDTFHDLRGHIGMVLYSPDGTQGVDVLNVAGFGGVFNIPADLAGDSVDIETVGADAKSNDLNELIVGGMTYGFNGATWDRLRTVGAGDSLSTGLLATGGYAWDGTDWGRLEGNPDGDLKTGPEKSANTASLTTLNATFISGGTTTVTVSDLDVTGKTWFSLGFTCDADALAGDHTFDIFLDFRQSGGVYHRYEGGIWGFARFTDNYFNPPRSWMDSGRIPPGTTQMQITVTANNLTTTESFIFTDWTLGLDSSS